MSTGSDTRCSGAYRASQADAFAAFSLFQIRFAPARLSQRKISMPRSIVAVLLFLATSATCIADINIVRSTETDQRIECIQWQVTDLVYSIRQSIPNPFDRQVFAHVTDDGRQQKVPLFYNGGNEWVFRFSSTTAGEKSFVLESDVGELNGQTGRFVVSKNNKPDRHGGIVLNDRTPNRFFHDDGTHYLNLAFECDWLFALDYGQDDLSKTQHLLSVLQAHGFNQVVMNVYSYDVKWPKDKLLAAHPEHEYGGREDIFPFQGSNSNPDFTALNVEFFKHFDQVISEMHDHEIVSHLMIYVWNKMVSWPEMNSAADNMYYDYVIKRYQAFPNIIWDVSKEALHYQRATKQYIVERIERTRRLDAFNRLVSVHDYGFCRNHSNLVDFISMQNWKHTLYQHMLEAAQEFPNKPIFNIEHGGYEESPYVVFPGAYVNAETCLRRNYMCLFAGGYTTYYWQGASWNVLIHNPFEQPEESPAPHFEYFTHMARLCELAKFENCTPMPGFNSSGYSLTNRKDGIALLYAPKENHSIGTGPLAKQFILEHATTQWFNTLTGELTASVPLKTGGFTFWDWRPWRGEADSVLIIRGLKPR